jgi:hypothetical protein
LHNVDIKKCQRSEYQCAPEGNADALPKDNFVFFLDEGGAKQRSHRNAENEGCEQGNQRQTTVQPQPNQSALGFGEPLFGFTVFL